MLTLRVSVIDNCQLRCSYCLPFGPKNVVPKNHWLKISDYEKLARAFLSLDFQKIRFTGGEPLIRPDLPLIIKVFSDALPKVPLNLTTNSLRFSAVAHELKNAGLCGITFHLDTLKSDRYLRLMGPGSVSVVLQNIALAKTLGFKAKINMVVQKGHNDDELADFLRLSRDLNVEVRFIELMNTGSAKDYVKEAFMSGQEILGVIGKSFHVKALDRASPSDPASRFLASDISFGLIASDTMPFCDNCNRLRLSVSGEFRTCLYQPFGKKIDIVGLEEEKIAEELEKIVAKKTSFHPLLRKDRSDFSMSQLGG